MLASTERNNAYLLENVVRSEVALPPVMAICRRHYNLQTNISCVAALLLSERVPGYEGVWKLHMLERSQDYTAGSRLIRSNADTWFENKAHRILIMRPSSRPEVHNKLFETFIQYNKYKIITNHSVIPVIRLHNDASVLSSAFAFLEQPENARYRHYLTIGPPISNDPVLAEAAAYVQRETRLHIHREAEQELDRLIRSMQQLPVAPVISSRIASATPILPQRIVNACIEGMLARGETCPIEMEQLTKETACLTPCGHTMTLSSAECWIRDAHSCPVCRAPVELPQLQRWLP